MKETLFSIPIYKYNVNNWEQKKQKLLNLFDNCETKKAGEVLTSPIYTKISILDEEIKTFEKESGLFFILHGFWFQKYEKNMQHCVHEHGAAGFSSVCFIEYDEECHKPTIFISPFIDSITTQYGKNYIPVKEGEIIFFPSNIMHYVPVNEFHVPRLIASFNLEIDNNTFNHTFIHKEYI